MFNPGIEVFLFSLMITMSITWVLWFVQTDETRAWHIGIQAQKFSCGNIQTFITTALWSGNGCFKKTLFLLIMSQASLAIPAWCYRPGKPFPHFNFFYFNSSTCCKRISSVASIISGPIPSPLATCYFFFCHAVFIPQM